MCHYFYIVLYMYVLAYFLKLRNVGSNIAMILYSNELPSDQRPYSMHVQTKCLRMHAVIVPDSACRCTKHTNIVIKYLKFNSMRV